MEKKSARKTTLLPESKASSFQTCRDVFTACVCSKAHATSSTCICKIPLHVLFTVAYDKLLGQRYIFQITNHSIKFMAFQKYLFIIYNKLLEQQQQQILSRSKQHFRGQTALQAGELGDNEKAIPTFSRKGKGEKKGGGAGMIL